MAALNRYGLIIKCRAYADRRRAGMAFGLSTGATVLLLTAACGPQSDPVRTGTPSRQSNGVESIRGDPIVPLPSSSPSQTNDFQPTTPRLADPVGADRLPSVATFQANVDGIIELGFDTLSAFDYEVRLSDPEGGGGRPVLTTADEIPAAVAALDGQRVSITGFVMPVRMQGRGLTQFLLARDQLSCCFGPSPQMNHWIQVTMPRGDFRPQIFRPAEVVGTLRVGALEQDGSIQSIYRLEAEAAEYVEETDPEVLKLPRTP